MAHDRRKSEEAGRTAELIALWYLRLKGWRLIAYRYKSPVGEVDLVMRRGISWRPEARRNRPAVLTSSR